MKTIVKLLSLIFILVFIGCAATWSTSNIKGVNGSKVVVASNTEQKSAQDIFISETDITDRKYKVLGDIEVTVNKTTIFHSDPTREKVNEKLKEEAAKLGADAVILVRYGTPGISLWSWGSMKIKGRAIVFLD